MTSLKKARLWANHQVVILSKSQGIMNIKHYILVDRKVIQCDYEG